MAPSPSYRVWPFVAGRSASTSLHVVRLGSVSHMGAGLVALAHACRGVGGGSGLPRQICAEDWRRSLWQLPTGGSWAGVAVHRGQTPHPDDMSHRVVGDNPQPS
jgi:hypothetical protein